MTERDVVRIDAGELRGRWRNGVWCFAGIPYGSPPEGNRRWRPPAPVEPWSGVRDALTFAPVCPQPNGINEVLGGVPEVSSEDCLYLNVWTPGLDESARPVMVWIHGGSFVTGSGSNGLYRAHRLAQSGDVVVVTINYRLGLFGFLSHPMLADPGQVDADGNPWPGDGNWGLADQVAALRWVQANIAAFGGDPDNVTLFGESAGGMSVAALLGAPAAEGLFHKAIVQSGPPMTQSREDAAEQAARAGEALDIPMERHAWEEIAPERLVEVAQSLAADASYRDTLFVKPVVDGWFLPKDPLVAVGQGAAARVPVLIGTTRDEWSLFALGSSGQLDEEKLLRNVGRMFPAPGAARRIVDAFRQSRQARGEPTEPQDLLVAVATEHIFRQPSYHFADNHRKTAESGVGTWVYYFTWESPAFGGALGSCHALEIPFVFGTVHHEVVQNFSGGGSGALALSDAMQQLWTGFARHGIPQWEDATSGPRALAPWSDERPVSVLGPWPGAEGPVHDVVDPRGGEVVVIEEYR